MFYWIKTNQFIKWLFSSQIWSVKNAEKRVYLTFDDGPTPEVTQWVLQVLKEQQIKATFFCIGENIQKYPDIFKEVIDEGHQIGNHSFHHLNGWKTDNMEYMEDIDLCQKEIFRYAPDQDKIFRPPYGKIMPGQSKKARKRGYKIIMWDVLSADFDIKLTPEQCLHNATDKVAAGSIIVFHDSQKAFENMSYALPKTIAILKEKGFSFGLFSDIKVALEPN